MRFFFLFFSACSIGALSGEGQSLPKKGFLGILAQPDSLNHGALTVQNILPNSTAAAIGIQQKDILLSINNMPVPAMKDFIAVANQLQATETVTVTIKRNKKIQKLKGLIRPRPLPFSDTDSVELGSFPHRGKLLRSVMLRPKGFMAKGCIYFIQGFPCFSMSYLNKEDAYVLAMEAFVREGYAVYFIEKPGTGDAINSGPCTEIGFDEELEAFTNGYEYLNTIFPSKNIALFGHSLGGIIAPILASRFQTSNIVVYGTVLKSWHDYLLDLLREQTPLEGVDYAEAEDSLKVYRMLLHQLFEESKSPQELVAQDPANESRLRTALHFDGTTHLIGRHYRFWQELNRYNLAAYWKNVNGRVLSIFGEGDVAALKAEDMQRITEIVNHYHPGNASYLFVPKTNHDMVRTGDLKENMKVQFSPQYPSLVPKLFNYELIEQVGQWMEDSCP